jgi:putative transposase
VVHERFQRWRRMGVFEKLMKRMAEYYAREHGGIGWKWQAMDSKHSAAPLGGQKTGNNPTDRGKSGAKINLLVDGRGAPISIVLTGANRHDKVSAIEVICSVVTKSPAHKEQHLCADKAYDESSKRIHPARRWMVERTISWLTKRRSLRTRWSKKAENWLALVQLACAHILLNLAVFG